MLKKYAILFLLPISLFSIELMKDYFHYDDLKKEHPIADDLVSGDTEVSSQVSDYENIIPNRPIEVSIFVTHDIKDSVDEKSFRIGEQSIQVRFISTTQMSSTSPISVSVYKWVMPGLPQGTHTLPAISVKVSGKEYQALPLVVEVFSKG